MKTTSELYDRLLNDGYDICDILQAIQHYITKTTLTLDYIMLAEQDDPTEKSIKSWVNYLLIAMYWFTIHIVILRKMKSMNWMRLLIPSFICSKC